MTQDPRDRAALSVEAQRLDGGHVSYQVGGSGWLRSPVDSVEGTIAMIEGRIFGSAPCGCACKEALDSLWTAIYDVDAQGDWEYPGEVARHFLQVLHEHKVMVEHLEREKRDLEEQIEKIGVALG